MSNYKTAKFSFNSATLNQLLIEIALDFGICAIWESSAARNEALETSSSFKAARYTYCILETEKRILVDAECKLSEQEYQRYFEQLPDFSDLDFPCGSIGVIAYDLLAQFDRIRNFSSNKKTPLFEVITPAIALVIDKQNQEIRLLVQSDLDLGKLSAKLQASILHAESIIDRQEGRCNNLSPLTIDPKAPAFIEKVLKLKDYIAAGDAYQIVLSLILSTKFNSSRRPDTLQAYLRLRESNPSPFHFYMRMQQLELLGASPELMLRFTRQNSGQAGFQLEMRPVAGTIPRGNTSELDQLQALTLKEHLKERAEHVMLVDHVRNDIGRVAKFGSVKVTDLLSVESYQNVHHLVSGVSGELLQSKNLFDAILSCLPIATLTGTPKLRAMEIISELEEQPRGIWGGMFFRAQSASDLEAAVIIRAAEIYENEIQIRAGAGIVYDSVPEREYEECLWKAQAVVNAFGFKICK
ncbi:anthranilate synthase component I family protein [bacterium]|nr:anthranilate synthase component I family protein [bacterium]